MLIGNKKTQQIGQDWFVVLNPLKSELERNKIAKEISKAFHLPVQDAFDLVANTPIILIDNLLYATALQVKQYFRSTQTDILVSNDSLLKRRCYRTVWPTPPSLSFLHQLDPQKMPQKGEEEKLDQEEAIQEIRSWVQTEGPSSEHGERTLGPKGLSHHRHFRNILEEDREKLLKETIGLKESLNQLRKSLEKNQTELAEKEKMLQISETARKQKEKETEELRSVAGHAEEKYELLREEFRQTRQYFEDKLVSQDKKSEEFLRQIEERDLINKELLQEKQVLQKSFLAVKSESQRSQDEQEQVRREWENQTAQLNRELESQKKMIAELNAKIQNLEEGKRIVQASGTRLMAELELQTQQAKLWEQRTSELEKEIRQLRESFEDQLKSWQLRLAQLEAREHELENARQQIQHLQSELDQRESIQKKNQIHEQLVAKESRLKHLVKQQEKIEAEIRDREEEMRKLLAEQESVEKEVIEAKQIQRHLNEKIKPESSNHDVRVQKGGFISSMSQPRPEVADD
ncbi:MAG TPA: hypothetical protein PLO78_08295 [Candidatus Omnitrophota bacterium]|nr:hypothetical protein [Candidatus Omnitrophota bacterium]